MHSCCPPAFPLPFVRAARSQVKADPPSGGQESGFVNLIMKIRMSLAPGWSAVSTLMLILEIVRAIGHRRGEEAHDLAGRRRGSAARRMCFL